MGNFFGGKTPARSIAAVAWAAAALMLSSCSAVSAAMGEESKDTAEVIASTPKPTPPPLDLGLDPADVIQEGTGDSGSLNTWGRPGTVVPPGAYLVHVQCRGTESLTFTFGTTAGHDLMTPFACSKPIRFTVSASGEGYGFSLNTNPADAAGVEYIFAVTARDAVSS